MKTECAIWTVAELLERYRRGEIIKPKIQRAQCWGATAADNRTNNEDFLDFVARVGNTINPLIFVRREKLILLDGNNRLNAFVTGAPVRSIGHAAVPVVILENITDEELIAVYEKINVTGIRLDHADILAATASTIIYNALSVPFFCDIYPLVQEHYAKNSAREALAVTLTDPSLNQYECLLGLGLYVARTYPILDDSKAIISICEQIYGDLRAAIPIADFIRSVDAAAAKITRWNLQRWHKMTVPPQALHALVTNADPAAVARAVIYLEILPILPTKKAHAVNAAKLRFRQLAPFRANNPLPDEALLSELFREALNETNTPVECASKKERRTPSRACAILLANYYEMYTPPVARADDIEVEHIVPYSTQWPRGTKLNIHRTGNLTLIPRAVNLARGNSHLTADWLASTGMKYSGYPTEEIYSNIVDKRRLISADEYNRMCHAREEDYIRAIFKRSW